MSKEIKQLEKTLVKMWKAIEKNGCFDEDCGWEPGCIFKALLDAGFRDVGELKEWVIEVRRVAQEIINLKENKISEVNYDGEIDFYKGKVDAYLRVLESL